MSLDDEPSVEETLHELRDEAPNQQVEDLLDLIGHLDARVKRLESIADPELDAPLQADYDRYDETVLAILQESNDEIVTTNQFKRLYRRHTKLRQDETIVERVKTLTDIGPFEWVDNGKWRFLGFPNTD